MGRVRVRGPATLRDAAPKVVAALQGIDWAAAGLPSGAILCVRALRDPAPGSLRLDPADPRPAPEWTAAMERELARLARAASRPADGPVPGDADAVVFRDRVELLTLLAEAAADGTRATSWWWRRLAPAGEGTSALLAAEPNLVPAVFDRLVRRGTAARTLAAMPAADAARLAVVTALTFGHRDLAAVLAGPLALSRALTAPGLPPSGGSVPAAEPRRTTAPWRDLLPAGAPEDPQRAALLGLALVLRRAPERLRSPAFGRALRGWWAGDAAGPAAVDRLAGRRAAGVPPMRSAPTAGRRPGVGTVGDDAASAEAPRAAHSASPTPAPLTPQPGPPVVGRRAPRRAAGRSPVVPQTTPRRPQAGPRAPGTSSEVAATGEAPDGPETPAELAVESGLAGALYLLNLALYLGLYADFTRPTEGGVDLDPWDFVALLTRALDPEADDEDPLWAFLAWAANRPADARPGAGAGAAHDWRLPPAWLAPFGGAGGPGVGEAWRWSGARGRLRVEHPAGFPVLDIAATSPVTRRAVRRELRPYGAPRPIRRSARAGRPGHAPARVGGRRVDRWIAWVAAYARVRLALALGLVDDDASGPAVIRHRGRIVVTETTVEVHLSLADLPIELRVAGLDRDPGWIPAARRAVAFRFR